MSPKKGEAAPIGESLSVQERADLVDALSEHINAFAAAYKNAANWEDARPYMGLVGMMAFLESPQLDGRQLGHIRKITANEYVALSQPEIKPRNTTVFLKEVRKQAAPEIAQVKKFKGEVNEMPQPYSEAFEDWGLVKEAVITDRLMLSLYQSLRSIRQNRQA